jgi:anti-anti-sigma factor
MNIEIKEQNGSYIGILKGWIDTAESSQFLEDMTPLMDNADKRIELNCDQLDYICSMGLRGILQLKRESTAKGGSMILTHVKSEVEKILKITGFNRLLDIR